MPFRMVDRSGSSLAGAARLSRRPGSSPTWACSENRRGLSGSGVLGDPRSGEILDFEEPLAQLAADEALERTTDEGNLDVDGGGVLQLRAFPFRGHRTRSNRRQRHPGRSYAD